jgi:uncharacterized RDD family membrane protein YckC
MNPSNSILKKRVYAFTTDLSIVVVANYFMMAAFTQFVQTVFFHFPIKTQLFLIHKMGTLSSISLMCFTFTYFSLFYFITNGKTMGKSLFGLQVKNVDGSEISLQQSLTRAIAYFICAIFGSFLFALSFIRKDQKSLADVLSRSVVETEALDENHIQTEFHLALIKSQKSEMPPEQTKEAA